MLIATDAFQAYTNAVGGTLDQTTGLLKISDPSAVNHKWLFLTCRADLAFINSLSRFSTR